MTKLSQNDSRWKNIRLGWGTQNTTTIGSHGCTITCIAMLAGLTPVEVNDRLIDVNGFAASAQNVYNLIIWSKIKEAIPWLDFEWRGYSYENDRVASAIQKNSACLVEVDFDGTPRTDDRHWVLFTGNQKMNDPWTGTERPTSDYSIVKGYSIINVIGKPPMSEHVQVESKLYEKLVHNSDVADKTVRYLNLDEKADNVSFDTIKNSLEAREGKLTTCKNELSTREASLAKALTEVMNREEQVSKLKAQATEVEKLHKAEVTALKSTIQNPDELLKPFKARIEQLETSLKAESVAKGKALIDLAEANSKLESVEKSQFGDMSFSRWLSLLTLVKWR